MGILTLDSSNLPRTSRLTSFFPSRVILPKNVQQLKAAKYSSAARLLALQAAQPTAAASNYRLSTAAPLNEQRAVSETISLMERQRVQAVERSELRPSQSRAPYPVAIASSHVGPFSEATGRAGRRSLSHPSARRESARSATMEATDAPLANPIALRTRWDLRAYRRALLDIDVLSDVRQTSSTFLAVPPHPHTRSCQAQKPAAGHRNSNSPSHSTVLYSNPSVCERSSSFNANPYECSPYCSLSTFSNSQLNH